MYSIEHDFRSGVASIVRDRDGARIPQDPRNADFAEFLEWNAKRPDPLDLTAIEVELPPPVKSPEELAAEFYAIDAESAKRQPFWDALQAVFWLKLAQEQPETMEQLINLTLQALGKDQTFRIRKPKG